MYISDIQEVVEIVKFIFQYTYDDYFNDYLYGISSSILGF